MSKNFNPYSNYGYMALVKESAVATPVKPTTYLRYVSEAMKNNYGRQDLQEVAGSRIRQTSSIQGTIELGGDIEIYMDEMTIGHFLRSILGAPITQTVATGIYRHVYDVSTEGKTYTIDICPAGAPWAHRYFGVYVTKISVAKDNNGFKVKISVLPTKAFMTAKVTTAAAAGTQLMVDQTSGLTTSDSILVLSAATGFTTVTELTIAAIVSETELTTSTIGASISVNDLVVIKKSTPAYTQPLPFQFGNGSAIYTGADIDNTTEEVKEDFGLDIESKMEAKYGSGLTEVARYPEIILTKGFEAKGKLSRFYDSQLNLSRLRSNGKFGLRYFFQKRDAITTNSSQKASSIWGTTANGFKVEAATAGKAGNDLNVTLVINTTDTLAATKSGNNITVKLASTTAASNTGTLIAAAISLLSGVVGTAEGTGAEQFTAAEPNYNLGFRPTNTNVVGADANTKAYLQFDFPVAQTDSYFPATKDDETVMEEIPLTFYDDEDATNPIKKSWNLRVSLVNNVSSY